MPVLTQEQAETKSLAIGIKMIGKYINAKLKIEFECPYCKKTFKSLLNNLYPMGHTKSCGCHKRNRFIDITGQRYGRLLVLNLEKIKNNIRYWNCLCNCGKNIIVDTASLIRGNTQSCGCLNKEQVSIAHKKDITNKRFGRLIAIQPVARTKRNNIIWNCLCDCGQHTEAILSDLIKGDTKSCGNCQLKRNGQTTSYKSLSLSSLLPLNAQHNYKFDKNSKKCIDWAFVYQGHKIALEYDEWYWHGHKQKEDNNRYRSLIRKNWKVIQVKAHNNIPSQTQINQALEKIVNGAKKVSITLSGWGQGKTIEDR